MKLSELLNEIEHERNSYQNPDITDIVYDSRKAVSGTVFVCLSGARADGHSYAASAYANGCRCFVCERDIELASDAVKVLVADSRKALAVMSAAYFKKPLKKLKLIGVTGTKGKTTVSSFIYQMLEASGRKAAVIGTNGADIDSVHYKTANTTPESYELHRMFAMMVDSRTEYAVIEVSSQAYKNSRVHAMTFDVGIFTNLSEDHIGPGEHSDMAEYIDCKSRLFENSKLSIINTDDNVSGIMLNAASGDKITYSIDKKSENRAENISYVHRGNLLGMRFDLNGREYEIPMPGRFNVYNALAAICVCKQLGMTDSEIHESIKKVSIKGRFELVDVLPDVTFIIDYAHNGISLKRLLETVREFKHNRIICLFGSVGERTVIRRKELAKVASAYADFCILTSDNPGNEEPMDIIDDIAEHMGDCEYAKIPDREEAICYAVKIANAGDIVVLAGKGHEDYQLIGKDKVPFSEKEILMVAKHEKKTVT